MSSDAPDAAPFLCDDSEAAEEEEEERGAAQGEEPISGVTPTRAVLTVFILCYVNLLNYMDRFTVAGVLPDIERYFGIDDSKSGLLQTVFICSYMFLAPLFGYLGDRYNRKLIMSGGIAFWSLVTLASSYTPKEHFWALLLTRGLVGVGEASYSTIAPTVIADLYVKESRTNMLSVFYFAIPVGSGLGYIVGSQVSNVSEDWHWALRVTPALGLLAVLLLLLVVREPKRGAVEARPQHQLHRSGWTEDLRALSRNPSFMLSTLGFTAVAFVTGSLALWAPTFLFRAAMFTGERAPCVEAHCSSSDSLIFGAVTCVTGVLGVAGGVQASRLLRTRTPRADPLVCAAGLLLAAPFLYLAIVFAQASAVATYVFIFLGETFLSMNWAIVADILLYVVVPTRRSTAEALQIVVSHLLGDAGSPYLIGVVSDSLRKTDSFLWRFRSLQLSLLLCSFVAVVGGAFFLAAALFIERDRHRADNFRPAEQDFPESSTGDYLIVLPEGEAPGTDRSGASTPSSGEPHDYENVRERTQHSPTGCRTRTLTDRLTVCLTVLLNGLCSSDDRDYLNVIPLPQGGETPSSSSSSQNDDDDDDDDSDDSDGEGKYVNEASVSTVKFCKLSVQTSRQSHAASIS